VAPERHLSRAERLDQHELHDRPISANSPPKRIPAATSATMSVITSTGRLNGSSPFETSPGGVDVLNCAVRKLTPLPTKNTTSASFSQRRILIGVRNSGDAERFLDVFDCVEGHESKYSNQIVIPSGGCPQEFLRHSQQDCGERFNPA